MTCISKWLNICNEQRWENSPGHGLNSKSFVTLPAVVVWSCKLLQGTKKNKRCLYLQLGSSATPSVPVANPEGFQGCILLSQVMKFGARSCSSSMNPYEAHLLWSHFKQLWKLPAIQKVYLMLNISWRHQNAWPSYWKITLSHSGTLRSHLQTHACVCNPNVQLFSQKGTWTLKIHPQASQALVFFLEQTTLSSWEVKARKAGL